MGTEALKQAIMSNGKLTDMEKLQAVFDISKGNLQKQDPQLYYAILAVLDANKKPDGGTYFY